MSHDLPAAKRGPIVQVTLMSHDLPAAESCDDAFLTEAVQALCNERDRKEVSPKEVSTTYFEMKSHKTLLPNESKARVSFKPTKVHMKGFPPKLTNEIKGKISHQN